MTNWGIVGFGEIAPAFLDALRWSAGSQIRAVASRAHADAARESVPDGVSVYTDYAPLLARADIDVVYIALVNPLHAPIVEKALLQGRHVVCEKPLTMSAAETARLCALARERERYLLEAMWTRFLPSYRKAMELIDEGAIGQPRYLQADFGFFNEWPPHRRLLNPDLGGGIVFDNTDYLVFLSQDVFKSTPSRVQATGALAETGVEADCELQLRYPCNGAAQLYSSFRQETLQKATIYGPGGRIELPEFWHGTSVELHTPRGSQRFSSPHELNGFEHQVVTVEQDLAAGRLENELVTHAMSLEVAEILDRVHGAIHA